MRLWAPPSLGLLVAAASSCGARGDGAGETTGATSSAIIDGVPSTDAQDFVVELVHPVAGGEFVCSGSLVAPNLVLTARHCVTATPDVGFSCTESGDGSDGGSLGADDDPETVLIFAGLDAPGALTAPAAHAVRFFHDDATNLCGHDLALVEVSPPLSGFPVAALDLSAAPSVGQLLTVVGWGVTADGGSPAERQQRTGVRVVGVGPAAQASGYDLGPSEFDVGESICEGDSGGPALDAAGSVVGVVSRGGNDDDAGGNLAATCVGPSTVNIYTETSALRDVILNAFAAIGATPSLVGVALGDTCFSSSQCGSALCVAGLADAGMVCSEACSSGECPSGFRCDTAAGEPLCAAAPSHAGCVVAPEGGGSGPSVAAFFLPLLSPLFRRRRARVSSPSWRPAREGRPAS